MTAAPPRPTAPMSRTRRPAPWPAPWPAPRRVLVEFVAMTDTAPDAAKKRARSRGPAQVPAGYQVPTETDELDCRAVAALLTHLGRPTVESTVRSYKRNGIMPVPDFQLGGHEPAPGEKIKCWSNGPRERDPAPGERIGAVYRWRASTIIAWNDNRTGGGRPPADKSDVTTPDGGWIPRRVKRTADQDDSQD